MEIKPVLHRIYILPEDVKEADALIASARKSGLIVELDKREQKAATTGTVVSIGSTAYKEFNTTAEEQGVVVGCKVLYAKYSGAAIPNSELLILNDEDILGVLE